MDVRRRHWRPHSLAEFRIHRGEIENLACVAKRRWRIYERALIEFARHSRSHNPAGNDRGVKLESFSQQRRTVVARQPHIVLTKENPLGRCGRYARHAGRGLPTLCIVADYINRNR